MTARRPTFRLTARKLRKIRNKSNGACAYCGKKRTRKLTLDHIEPLARGGTNRAANLVLACVDCNHDKGGLTLVEWLDALPLGDKRRELIEAVRRRVQEGKRACSLRRHVVPRGTP